MPLALYSDKFWTPNGVLATAVPARVFPLGSNGLAPIFADAAGTIPLTNPLNTDAGGFLTFYAEVGEYWVHLDSESFQVSVGMTQEQADLSTGLASGGFMSQASPTSVNIAPFDGWIVDFTPNNASQPPISRVKTTLTQTVALDAASLLRPVTWWLADTSGTIIQQGTRPTQDENRRFLTLGVTGLASGVLSVIQTLPVSLNHPVTQMYDLFDALRPFNVSGNVISPNGVNLNFNQTSGQLFARSFNRFTGLGVRTNNPHVPTTIAQTPVQFRHVTQTTTTFGATVTALDVGNYDVGGTVTAIPGGANTATNFRVWLAPTLTASEQIIVQYGQAFYASLPAAVAAIGTGTFVPNVVAIATGMVLIGYISVIKSATNLSDVLQATFTQAPKFALA